MPCVTVIFEHLLGECRNSIMACGNPYLKPIPGQVLVFLLRMGGYYFRTGFPEFFYHIIPEAGGLKPI